MRGGATQSPLKLGRGGAARTARSDPGFFWNEAGVGGREKEIERRAALGQRRQSGGDNSHEGVADFGDEMREFALPQHFAQMAADPIGIAVFRGKRQMLRTNAKQPARARRRPVTSHDEPIVAGAYRNHSILAGVSLHDYREQIGAPQKLRREPIGRAPIEIARASDGA